MLIKCDTGNSKYRPHKYKCPKCGNVLNIAKPYFLTECSKCKTLIKKDELIEIEKEE